METKGLLFIPDISGFTKFVTESEINHSRLIIRELLELLINANEIGLQVSEIEGDAILFYKFGPPPRLEELYPQVEKMFCLFHKNLIAYEQRRYCQCLACTSAAALSLKVITHYGEFTDYNVKNFSKLIGKDVIVAHQLLKNDIVQHEYWLVTKSLLQENQPKAFTHWMHWSNSIKQTETGEIYFHYTQLSQLKNELPAEPIPRLDLKNKKRIYSASKKFETAIITLFHAAGTLEYRHRWWQGIKRVEVLNHFLPRVGMRSRWIMINGKKMSYASSYFYSTDRIEFSETNEKTKEIIYYTLIKKGDARTELTIDIYRKTSRIKTFMFNVLGKQKIRSDLDKSLQSLAMFANELE